MLIFLKKIRINTKFLCKIIIFYCFFMNLFIDIFGIPALIRYVNDFLLVLAVLLLKNIKVLSKKKFQYILYSILIYFIICLIGALFNFVSPFLFIWAFRNTFRGLIYFLLLIEVFEIIDVKKIINVFFVIQFFSLLLAIYQYVILNHHQDDIGGIFGYGDGASLNAFNALMISYYLYGYLTGENKFWKFLVTVIVSLIISALAEEKMTFIFLIIILGSMLFIPIGRRIKKIWVLLTIVVSMIIGLFLVRIIYPDVFETMISIKNLFGYAQSTYEDGYMLPRIGSFKEITKLFFDFDPFNCFFGIGFGNGETSSFSIFQSSFYLKYGHYNYRWFCSQWIFIEQGYLGFVSYLLIFIIMFISIILKFRGKRCNKRFLSVGLVMILYAILSLWYNASLKTDACYLIFFAISIGFIGLKQEKYVRNHYV